MPGLAAGLVPNGTKAALSGDETAPFLVPRGAAADCFTVAASPSRRPAAAVGEPQQNGGYNKQQQQPEREGDRVVYDDEEEEEEEEDDEEEPELRIDPVDGNPYPYSSFIEEYGIEHGPKRWNQALPLDGAPERPAPAVTVVGRRQEKQASRSHMLRRFVLWSARCPLCQMLGPSPQTGVEECAFCRRCERCCSRWAVCPLRSAEPAAAAPRSVRWRDPRNGAVVQLAAAPAQPGALRVVVGAAAARVSGRAEYVPPSGGHPPRVRLSDCGCTVTLPRARDGLQGVLRKLRAIADAQGTSHDLPASVEADGTLLPRTLHRPRGGAAPVVALALAAQSDCAATVHADSAVRWWDLRGGGHVLWSWLPRNRTEGSPRAPEEGWDLSPRQLVDLSPDERIVAVAGRPGGLIDVATGNRTVRFSWDEGLTQGTTAVAFSPCGRYVLAVGDDGAAAVWSPAQGTPLCNLPAAVVAGLRRPGGGPAPLASFSPSGGLIAAAAPLSRADQPGVAEPLVPAVIAGWRRGDGSSATLRTFTEAAHAAALVALRFSADGTELLSASVDGELKISDVDTGVVRSAWSSSQGLRGALFFGGGSAVVVFAAGCLHAWERKRGTLIVHEPFSTTASCGFDVAAERVCVGSSDGALRLAALPYPLRPEEPPDDGHPQRRRPRRRAAQAHGGQRPLLALLCWQTRLAAHRLPAGITPLRRLEQPLLRALCEWLPDPCAGDGPRDVSQCRMM